MLAPADRPSRIGSAASERHRLPEAAIHVRSWTREMMTESLVVSEVFGPTWQGEGPSIGRRCGFVRLGRCNLACTWCDTPYTWDWERYDPAKELHRRLVTEVVADL